jgi:hypothetical protein
MGSRSAPDGTPSRDEKKQESQRVEVGCGQGHCSARFHTEKNGKWYLTMNTTKDALKNAHGYKYDKAKATWVPA